MKKKKIVIALGHEALGTTLPEQKEATKRTAKAVADFIRDDYQVVITHSNGLKYPTYSALASLEPDFPLAPVYLLNTSPLPKYAALRFVITDG